MFLTEKKLRSLVRRVLLTESHHQEDAFLFAWKTIQSYRADNNPNRPIDIVFANQKRFKNVTAVVGTGKQLNKFGSQMYTDVKITHEVKGRQVTSNISMKGPTTPAFAGGGASGMNSVFLQEEIPKPDHNDNVFLPFQGVNLVEHFMNKVRNYIINAPGIGPNRDFKKYPYGSPPLDEPNGFYARIDDFLFTSAIYALMKGTEEMGGPLTHYVKGTMTPTYKCGIDPYINHCELHFEDLNLYTLQEAFNKFVNNNPNGIHIYVKRKNATHPINVLLGQEGEIFRELEGGAKIPFIFGPSEQSSYEWGKPGTPQLARYKYESEQFAKQNPNDVHPVFGPNINLDELIPGTQDKRYIIFEGKIYDLLIADPASDHKDNLDFNFFEWGMGDRAVIIYDDSINNNPSIAMYINGVKRRDSEIPYVYDRFFSKIPTGRYGDQSLYSQSINLTENPPPLEDGISKMVKIDLKDPRN